MALVTGHDDRMRLWDALAGTAQPHFVGSVAEVLHAVRADRGAIRAVLLEARDMLGHPAAGLARQITRLFPGLPIVGYCSLRPEDSQDIVALSSAGVHELVFKQHDDNAALLSIILSSADQSCVADLVLEQLEDRLPARLRPLVEYCLTNAEHAHSVDAVARALGVHRKTLVNYCRLEGFPAPGAVLAWCLILLAVGLLASPGVTVERIALQLDFPSATALRNMVKRYTGVRPCELRASGALAELCVRFLGREATRRS